jgi:Tfp pilus assembly protein PilV
MKRQVVNKPRRGFSLIEVLVFSSVLSVALIAIIGTSAYSSLLLNNACYRIVAARYSEELAEWLKYQREYYGYSQISGKANNTYCFNNTEALSWPVPEECSSYSLDNIFKREATLTLGGSKTKIVITTSYRFLNRTPASTIEMNFNEYSL